MGFNIRHYPEDVKVLEDKLKNNGSHYLYNMYIKRVECWIGNDKTKDSELFIDNFMKKYNETNLEFHSLSEETQS